MISYQSYFEKFLSLQGSEIEVGLRSTGKSLQGKIVNTMFDSLLLSVGGKHQVVRFEDMLFVNTK